MCKGHFHRNYSQSLIICVKHVEAVAYSFVFYSEYAESREER